MPTISKSVGGVKLVLLETRWHVAAIDLTAPHIAASDSLVTNPTHGDMLAARSDNVMVAKSKQ